MRTLLARAAAVVAVLAMVPPGHAATDVTTGDKNVSITVPARLVLTINTGTATMTADPADTNSTNVALQAAQLSIKSNYGTTTLSVSATQPTYTDGGGTTHTIDYANYQFQINGTVTDGLASSSTINAGSSWTAFSNLPTLLMTINGRTDATLVDYDFQVLRSWAYTAGTYTSTVTYTIAGI